jgi:hypothetical protein
MPAKRPARRPAKPAARRPARRDPAAELAAIRAEAAALVKRMTLPEKVGQMLYQAPAIERLGIPAYN